MLVVNTGATAPPVFATYVSFPVRLNEPRREKTCLRVCDQVILKPACSASETNLSLKFQTQQLEVLYLLSK